MVKSWWQCLPCHKHSILQPPWTLCSVLGSLHCERAVARIHPVSLWSRSFSVNPSLPEMSQLLASWWSDHPKPVGQQQWLPQQVFQSCLSPALSLLGEPATSFVTVNNDKNNDGQSSIIFCSPAQDRKVSFRGYCPIPYWAGTCKCQQRKELQFVGQRNSLRGSPIGTPIHAYSRGFYYTLWRPPPPPLPPLNCQYLRRVLFAYRSHCEICGFIWLYLCIYSL